MYKKGHRSPAESEWTQSMFFCLSQHHKQNWKDLFLHPTQIKLLLVHAIPVNKKKKIFEYAVCHICDHSKQ